MTGRFRLFKRISKSKKKTDSDTASVSSQQEIPTSSSSVVTSQQPPSSKPTLAVTAPRTDDIPRKSLGQTNPNNQTSMDEELVRMREELSRATITCKGREMEAARARSDLQHCKEELARISAVKTEADNQIQKLQAEVASLEREKSRLLTDVERMKEDLQRLRPKLADKKKVIAELKKKLQQTEEEKNELDRGVKDREQTWQTIRHDVTSKRDDAFRESCKLRRENEKLKSRISRLKTEKSNILLRIWEKKQTETSPSLPATSYKYSGTDSKDSRSSHHGREESGQYAKVLSLELQLFRQARLVELLLDVIQSYDPQFTVQQRHDLTSAFADAGSIPETMSRKVTFA